VSEGLGHSETETLHPTGNAPLSIARFRQSIPQWVRAELGCDMVIAPPEATVLGQPQVQVTAAGLAMPSALAKSWSESGIPGIA
jgi:hypothetical protein